MQKLTIEGIKARITPLLKKYGVKKAALFGSIVRGEARPDSDIDILVDIESDISLLDFVGLKIEIEEALGKKVDLVEYSTIKPLLKDRILGEQRVIL
jgi:predicted nucleotidyltransferase